MARDRASGAASRSAARARCWSTASRRGRASRRSRSVAGKSITTLEGLPAWYAQQKRLANAPELHPLQQAVIDEQALQCGYCYNGLIIKGAELLSKNPRPTDAQIRTAMNGHLCRCGTYPRMIKAIQRASRTMAGGGR